MATATTTFIQARETGRYSYLTQARAEAVQHRRDCLWAIVSALVLILSWDVAARIDAGQIEGARSEGASPQRVQRSQDQSSARATWRSDLFPRTH